MVLLDFGVAELIHTAAGQKVGALNPRYAAPELFEGRILPSGDAYSLAVIYAELLTGAHPFRNVSPRHLASAARQASPGRDPGPGGRSGDRAAAAAPGPGPAASGKCAAFIAALEAKGGLCLAGSRLLRHHLCGFGRLA